MPNYYDDFSEGMQAYYEDFGHSGPSQDPEIEARYLEIDEDLAKELLRNIFDKDILVEKVFAYPHTVGICVCIHLNINSASCISLKQYTDSKNIMLFIMDKYDIKDENINIFDQKIRVLIRNGDTLAWEGIVTEIRGAEMYLDS